MFFVAELSLLSYAGSVEQSPVQLKISPTLTTCKCRVRASIRRPWSLTNNSLTEESGDSDTAAYTRLTRAGPSNPDPALLAVPPNVELDTQTHAIPRVCSAHNTVFLDLGKRASASKEKMALFGGHTDWSNLAAAKQEEAKRYNEGKSKGKLG